MSEGIFIDPVRRADVVTFLNAERSDEHWPSETYFNALKIWKDAQDSGQKMSIRALARELGIKSHTTVRFWLNGTSKPPAVVREEALNKTLADAKVPSPESMKFLRFTAGLSWQIAEDLLERGEIDHLKKSFDLLSANGITLDDPARLLLPHTEVIPSPINTNSLPPNIPSDVERILRNFVLKWQKIPAPIYSVERLLDDLCTRPDPVSFRDARQRILALLPVRERTEYEAFIITENLGEFSFWSQPEQINEVRASH